VGLGPALSRLCDGDGGSRAMMKRSWVAMVMVACDCNVRSISVGCQQIKYVMARGAGGRREGMQGEGGGGG
jgi:hypothetical protein